MGPSKKTLPGEFGKMKPHGLGIAFAEFPGNSKNKIVMKGRFVDGKFTGG